MPPPPKPKTPNGPSSIDDIPLNEPPNSFFSYTTLIYGPKGVGKTSLAACWPSNVAIAGEPRRRGLAIRQLEVNPQLGNCWNQSTAHLKSLLSIPDVESITIDTADRLFDWAMTHICATKGVVHPNDMNDFGKTWSQIKVLYEEALRSIIYSGKSLVLVSHERMKELEDRLGQVVCNAVVPTLPESSYGIIKALVDFLFYYGWYGPNRVIRIRGDHHVAASCGVADTSLEDGHFLTPNGEPIAQILVGSSAASAAEALQLAFSNQLPAEQCWTVSQLASEVAILDAEADRKSKKSR